MNCRFLHGLRQLLLVPIVLVAAACSPAPDVDFHTDTGGPQLWHEQGGQYVVVNYFAEWCAPCLRELPELNAFHQKYGDRVRLYGVSFDGLNNAELAVLREKHNIQFPLVLNEPMARLPFSQPQMLPATYIITPAGEIKGPLLGEQTVASLKQVTELTD